VLWKEVATRRNSTQKPHVFTDTQRPRDDSIEMQKADGEDGKDGEL
jgi:hypothetical protein